MKLIDVWNLLVDNKEFVTFLVIVVMTTIEIVPFKINPWSFIGKALGKFLGISAISEKLNALEQKVDENQATTIRVRILRFEDELQLGKHHSKDAWDQAMDDVHRYEEYTSTHPDFKNEITVASTNHIRKEYAERLEKHDFRVI